MNEIKAHIKTCLLLKKNGIKLPNEITVAGKTMDPEVLIARWKKLTDLNNDTTRMEIAAAMRQGNN